jgi:anaerobic ribonucleoside-triphosphate reductase
MYDVSEKLYDAVKKKYYGKKKPAAYCYRCGADHSPVLDSCPICGQDDEDDDGWGSLPSSLDWVAHESRCCVFVFTNGVIGDLLALASNGVPYFDRSKLLV